MNKIPRFVPSLTINELVHALTSRKKSAKGCDPLQLFTMEFAEYIGVAYAIPAPSGRAALAAALYALQLPKNGEVILPTLVHHSFVTILREFNLRPRFVDVNYDSFCINVKKLKTMINSSTVGIIPVHLYGRACNMEVIRWLAEKYKLVIIEDCAQACGAYYKGRRVGSLGDAAVFSFHAHKNLSALGMGMLVVNSKTLAYKALSWLNRFPKINNLILAKRFLYSASMRLATRSFFWDYIIDPVLKCFDSFGCDLIESLTDEVPTNRKNINYQGQFMPGLFQGRIGLAQLKKIDLLNQQRIEKGNKLLEYLQEVEGIHTMAPATNGENIYMSFIICVSNRKKFRYYLRRLGVDTHRGNMFVGPCLWREENDKCDVAIQIVNNLVHLPIYPQVSEKDLIYVKESVAKVISQMRVNNELY